MYLGEFKDRVKYKYKGLRGHTYRINPPPPNYELLEKIEKVAWVKPTKDAILVKCDRPEVVRDIVDFLNSSL